MQRISRITDAVIPNNALVLLDIDDTVLHLRGLGKGWWKAMQDMQYEELQCHSAARASTLVEWISRARSAVPERIDTAAITAFLRAVRDARATLVFVTARSAALHELTLAQLELCDLGGFPVIHAEAKGAAARTLQKEYNASNIVFIDDMECNVADVAAAFDPERGVHVDAYVFTGS